MAERNISCKGESKAPKAAHTPDRYIPENGIDRKNMSTAVN